MLILLSASDTQLDSLVIRKIPDITNINDVESSARFTCSYNNNIAKITPKSDEVDSIITDLIAPTSFIPIMNKKMEPANPPRLKKTKIGTSYNSKLSEIFKRRTIINEIDPPINDFS